MLKLKKKVKKKLKIIVIIILAIIISFNVGNLLGNIKPASKNNNNSNYNEKKDKKDKEDKEDKEEEKIKTYTASLIATGDGLIHKPIYESYYNKDTNTYDFSSILTYTKEKIQDYDIRYYNQETIFDDNKAYSSYPVFNTPSAFGNNMLDAGFNLVSLATNHSMDGGATSAKVSATYWRNKKDILATGMFYDEIDRNNYPIMEKNGITYTMLSYTTSTNGLGANALAKEPFILNTYNEEVVKKDIEAVRDKVDVLIVAMHWGVEYYQDATTEQKNIAKFLADNGVDIVLGTHSHCIEPWEKIGDMVVFYSLGNFVSNQMGAETAKVRKVGVVGMFATLNIVKTVDKEHDTTTIEIKDIGADLNYSYRSYNSTKGKNDYLVIPFSKMESKYLNNYSSVYDEFSKVLKKYDESINIEPIPSVVA